MYFLKMYNDIYTKGVNMEWFKKHTDTAIILGAFASSILWMNGRFNTIEKDIVMIKTVLILKNIMPTDLAKVEDK